MDKDFPQTFPPAEGYMNLTVTNGEFKRTKIHEIEYFYLGFGQELYAHIMPERLPFIRKNLEAMGIVCENRPTKTVLVELIGKAIPCQLFWKQTEYGQVPDIHLFQEPKA